MKWRIVLKHWGTWQMAGLQECPCYWMNQCSNSILETKHLPLSQVVVHKNSFDMIRPPSFYNYKKHVVISSCSSFLFQVQGLWGKKTKLYSGDSSYSLKRYWDTKAVSYMGVGTCRVCKAWTSLIPSQESLGQKNSVIENSLMPSSIWSTRSNNPMNNSSVTFWLLL